MRTAPLAIGVKAECDEVTAARWLIVTTALVAAGCSSDPARDTHSAANRNALRTIISQCLDASVSNYCARCPTPIEGTCGVTSCWNSIDVWAETADFVAIRDRKMCHCPPGFVHGLALPRAFITGVEDPNRPDGIWPFAWQVALTRIAASAEIALVVNPPYQRTQDELHVHIVRLLKNGRELIDARRPVRIESLDAAWRAAATHAKRMGYATYGVAVMHARDGGYLVVSTNTSPEWAFTESTCRRGDGR